MFKSTQDLQEFILWCLQNGVERVKVDNLEVQFSNIYLAEKLMAAPATTEPVKANEERDTSKTLVDTVPNDADEELLFWSAKN